jgi:isopenicillin N synthase-like dioxygenase
MLTAIDETTPEVKLSCTPHTDSGILTLLHQDPTGGLEVLNSTGSWIPAPYIPNTIVVNIGDLMAKVSGGRWVATMHRVRAPMHKSDEEGEHGPGFGRFSVPFFFEPGEECWVRDVDGGDAVRYGDHVRAKMKTWVEFQGSDDEEEEEEEEVM